jgi:hypothetical protein
MGYSEDIPEDELWSLLEGHKKWGSLMGCSIQSLPGTGAQVEVEAGCGLHIGHAYSLLDVGSMVIDSKPIRLVKLRNPWGKGEWEGAWSDRSEEREKYDAELTSAFGLDETLEVNFQDGTFLMAFSDWRTRFTTLFMAVNFPPSWTRKQLLG